MSYLMSSTNQKCQTLAKFTIIIREHYLKFLLQGCVQAPQYFHQILG